MTRCAAFYRTPDPPWAYPIVPRSSGPGSGLRGEALRPRPRIDAAQQDGGQGEEPDSDGKCNPGSVGQLVLAADQVDQRSNEDAGKRARRGHCDVADAHVP